MEIQPKQPTVKAGTDTFTREVWLDLIARGEEPSRVRVNVVRFARGARNVGDAPGFHAVARRTLGSWQDARLPPAAARLSGITRIVG